MNTMNGSSGGIFDESSSSEDERWSSAINPDINQDKDDQYKKGNTSVQNSLAKSTFKITTSTPLMSNNRKPMRHCFDPNLTGFGAIDESDHLSVTANSEEELKLSEKNSDANWSSSSKENSSSKSNSKEDETEVIPATPSKSRGDSFAFATGSGQSLDSDVQAVSSDDDVCQEIYGAAALPPSRQQQHRQRTDSPKILTERLIKHGAYPQAPRRTDSPDLEEITDRLKKYSPFPPQAPRQRQQQSESPDIVEITERLKKLQLETIKPKVKYLEEIPVPAVPVRVQPKIINEFGSAAVEEWKDDVGRAIAKLCQTISSMPSATEDHSEFQVPRKLRVELFPHQIYGVKWMWWREHQYPGGGILADEMGLGKTIMTISLILMGKESQPNEDAENWLTVENRKLVPTKATLVVCPVGCIPQWENELKTKAKGLKILVYHGANRTHSPALVAQNDVVITSYPTVGSEISKKDEDPMNQCRSPLFRLSWERIVLDEGHIIRNPKTVAAQAICRITARHRWVVTGTPVHNKPEDFFSLVKFLQLKPFDDEKVWKFWIGAKNVPTNNLPRLHTIGKAMILRRTKEECKTNSPGETGMASIPSKTVEIVEVELREDEAVIYNHLYDYAKQKFKVFLAAQKERQAAMQGAANNFNFGNAKGKKKGEAHDVEDVKFSHFLALLLRLRQAAVLPHLIRTMIEDEDVDEADESYDPFEDPVNQKNPVFNAGYKSAKIRAVMRDLEAIRAEGEKNGVPMDKVIIVSQWTSLLEIVAQHLTKRGFSHISLTGVNKVAERSEIMMTFNSKPKKPQVMLLSLNAGGVGLNLVGANHVFFLDIHWNPQNERQAQDRVHRFGQTKPVIIKRYIAKDTIEEVIMELQEKKLQLSEGLLNSAKMGKGAGLSVQDMRTIFGL